MSNTTDTGLYDVVLHGESLIKCEAEILDGGKFGYRRKLTGELERATFARPYFVPNQMNCILPVWNERLYI